MNTTTTDQTIDASHVVADVTDATTFTDVTDMAFDATDSAEIDTAKVDSDSPHGPAMRILRIKDCASLSGRSTLTYHIGCSKASNGCSQARAADNAANPEIHIRLFANSAKGYFCKDWLPMASVEVLLSDSTGFSSGDVQRLLYEGKSVNSGGFLMAALRHEGLIRTTAASLRSYEALDSTAWQLEILALIESGVALSEMQAAPPPVAKTPGSKKAKKAGGNRPSA